MFEPNYRGLAFAALTLLAGAGTAAAQSVELKSGACEGLPEGQYICGPVNAEELLHLEGTPWIFTSQLHAPFLHAGAVQIVHSETFEWGELAPDGTEADFDRATYPDCPEPLLMSDFSGHGMTFGPMKDGVAMLYAVNHGKRESVEVFEVTAKGSDIPAMRWVGCMPSPNNDALNTVGALPDGGIVGSVFYEMENAAKWFPDMISGKTSGQVFEWHAGKGWAPVPRTYMSGPNGVVSVDGGDKLIVAEWGISKLHKLSRDGSGDPVTVDVVGRPDNIHPNGHGTFYVVAQTSNMEQMGAFGACMGSDSPVCGGPFRVYEINPDTLELTLLADTDMDPAIFGYASSALDMGDKIWLGTVRGNKIMIMDKKM